MTQYRNMLWYLKPDWVPCHYFNTSCLGVVKQQSKNTVSQSCRDKKARFGLIWNSDDCIEATHITRGFQNISLDVAGFVVVLTLTTEKQWIHAYAFSISMIFSWNNNVFYSVVFTDVYYGGHTDMTVFPCELNCLDAFAYHFLAHPILPIWTIRFNKVFEFYFVYIISASFWLETDLGHISCPTRRS